MGGGGGQRRAEGRVRRLTGKLCMGHLDERCLVSGLSPLEMRIGELEEASELFVRRLSGTDDGRHAGVTRRPPLIR